MHKKRLRPTSWERNRPRLPVAILVATEQPEAERSLKIDGSCYCGAVRFEAEASPDAAVICHCSDCQRFSGSAFRISIGVSKESFKLLAGVPKTFIKTAASGSRRIQAFCADCGTALYATAVEGHGTNFYNIRAGTVSQRSAFRPTKQIWVDSSVNWLKEIDTFKAWPGEIR